MTRPIVNLSDPVSTLVSKTNTISTNVGDPALLTGGDSDVVAAINRIDAIVVDLDDSIEVAILARGGFSALNTTTSGTAVGRIDYDSASGIIGYYSSSDSVQTLAKSSLSVSGSGFGSLSYNSGTGAFTYSGATATQIKSVFQKDSAGGILFDSSTGAFSVAPNSVTNNMITAATIRSSRFYNLVTLEIQDSDGSVLKTIYSPGA
jgi:hypothetical protein